MANSDEGGLLVGKTDKGNGKGIKVLAPEGDIIMGGGEIVINEKSSTKHCETLSEINQDGGGVAIPCDEQKTANKGPMEDGGKICPVELQKGIKDEEHHRETFESLAAGNISVETAIKETAKDHLREDPNFYKKMDAGGKTFKERINVEQNSENFKDIRQSLDEFFTPEWVAQIMFDLAIKHGFKGGSVLEPSVGHGVFFDVAMQNESKTELGIAERDLYGFEIYKPNYDFVKKAYPDANLFDHNFEYQFIDKEIFFKKNKIEKSLKFQNKQFDLCIGNPPYGSHKSPHAYYFKPELQVRIEGFFIYLALQKLKPGGLLVFIINSLWLQNGNLYNKQKEQIAKYGELIDAYRLPNKTFENTDIATDIVVFKRK